MLDKVVEAVTEQIMLFGNSGEYITQKQGVDGAKATVTKVATPKAVALAYQLKPKDAKVLELREQAMQNIKTGAIEIAGQLSVNPEWTGAQIRHSETKNGERLTLTFVKPTNSKLDEVIAKSLRMTIDEVKQMRRERIEKEAKHIDVPTTTTPTSVGA